MSESSEEPIYTVEKTSEFKEGERKEIIPIINVVRHGSTDYKELKNPNFKFDPEASDFKLDPEHLDLNEQGIKEIEEAADQLTNIIDKDNEVVILQSSPNFRAMSSTLVLENKLKEKGITILASAAELHPGKTIREAPKLQQIKYRRNVDKDSKYTKDVWIKKHQELIKERPEEFKDQPPDKVHQKVAKELGGELRDWFNEDYGNIEARFNNFLRHMTNIDHYLSDEAKNSLEGKKLRIISVTHEELPVRFLRKTLGEKATLKKGQMMELQPQSTLEAGGETEAKVKLYPKGKEEAEIMESSIKIGFNP